MSLYKYVSADGLRRFLEHWELRLTPPHVFNDPFEFYPPFPAPCAVVSFFAEDPRVVEWGLKRLLSEANQVPDNEWRSRMVLDFLLENDTGLATFVLGTMGLKPSDRDKAMSEFRRLWRDHINKTLSPMKIETLINRWPDFTRQLGVICFSRSLQHLLLWAHYADNHEGAVISFSEATGPLAKPDHLEARFGYGDPFPIRYQDSLPNILTHFPPEALASILWSKEVRLRETGSDKLPNDVTRRVTHLYAGTKSLDWAYEQEIRLLMRLSDADRTIDSEPKRIHLLRFPPRCVESITIGCRAEPELGSFTTNRLAALAGTDHIQLSQARMDTATFALRMIPIASPSRVR